MSKLKTITKTVAIGLTAGLACAALTGCATIAHGDKQKLTVNSKPSHASLTVDGTTVGKTPAILNLSRKNSHNLSIALAGYKTENVHLENTLSGWVLGNIVFGGVIGIAVDAVDGAMYKLTPSQVTAYSAKEGIQFNEDNSTLTVFLVKHGHKNWQKIGKLQKAKA